MANNIVVSKETYAIVKAKKPVKAAFANIIDAKETTVIIDKNKISKSNIVELENDYKLITFDMVLPFSMTGFIAKIATALADEKIPIFVISSYSTDHILVKENFLEKAVKKLKSLGFER